MLKHASWCIFAFLAACAFVLAWYYRPLTREEKKTEIVKKLESLDPRLAKTYSEMQSEKDWQALKATLTYYQNSLPTGLDLLKKDFDASNSVPYFEYIRLAMNCTDDTQGKLFLEGQNSYQFQKLMENGLYVSARQYLDALKQLQEKGGDNWVIIREDPSAIGVYVALRNRNREDLWKFYVSNKDWLPDLIANTAMHIEDIASDNHDVYVEELVATAQKYKKTVQKMYQEMQSAEKDAERHVRDSRDVASSTDEENGLEDAPVSMILPFMMAYGDVVQTAFNYACSPLETLAIININEDFLKGKIEKQGGVAAGEYLARIKNSKPWLWQLATDVPMVLQFDERVPQYSQKILDKYSDIQIATLLFLFYGEAGQLEEAARAIHVWDDLGVAVLLEYRESDELKRHLTNPKVGFRVVPMILKFGINEAFERIDDDVAWVNRYVDQEGNLKVEKTSFLEMLPLVGSLVTVGKHWAKGEPCEWSELGWAAFDVLDTAILLASFGASAGVSAAAKNGAKASIGSALKKTGGKVVTRATVKKTASRGAYATLLRTFRSVRKISSPVIRVITAVGRTVAIPFRYAYQGLKYAYRTWKALPPLVRKFALRVIGGIMLAISIKERIMPELPKVIGNLVKDITTHLGDTIKEIGINFCKAVASGITGSDENWAFYLFLIICAVFLFMGAREFRKQSRSGNAIQKL